MAVNPAYDQQMYYNQQPVMAQPVMAQPAVQSTTMVIMQQPQVQVQQRRQWSSGMCGCFEDMASCCCVMWCAPFYLCYLSSEMDEGCCMPWCVPYALPALRTKIRSENKINGSILSDCCTTYWCGACVMCQLKREHDYVSRM